MFKKIVSSVLMATLVLSITGCGSSSTATTTPSEDTSSASAATESVATQDVYNLRLAYTLAADHDLSKAFETFAANVEEETGGQVVITTYPAGQLGTQPENLESVRMGSLDMCYADTSMLCTYVPEYNLINLPWLITSFDLADEIFYNSDIVDSLDASLSEQMNMTSLGWLYQGFRAFCTTTPLTSAADCSGVKLRSPEVDLYLDTFNLMGFSPTVITWTEAYSSMQSGVVEGIDTVKSSILSYGFYDIGEYVWNSNHMFSSVGLVINNDVWASLDPEYQEIVQSNWDETIASFNASEIARDEEYIQKFESVGATVTYTADESEFREIFKDYWTESADENGFTEELEKMMEIIEG